MAITLITGFETGHPAAEAFLVNSSTSFQTSIVRSGAYAFRSQSNAGGPSNIYFQKRAAGGTSQLFSRSCRYYLRVGSLPNAAVGITFVCNGFTINLRSTGELNINGGTNSTQTLSADGLWHSVEAYISGATAYVDVDGVNWCSAAFSGSTANSVRLGFDAFSNQGDLYFDDLVVSDSDRVTTPIGSKQLLLLPTADPAALNSWTNGGGGTTSIFEGVNNIPPIGAAAATNGIKIKNAASGSNLDYVATMQTYIAAGVPIGSKINAVMALCNHGEEVSTGTKAGAVWIASNPAQSAGSGTFDYGDDTATVVGTFPTGWQTRHGDVAENPSVTLSTAPTMTVRKTGSTTRVVDVDFMGIYVDYTPPPVQQSVSSPAPSAFPYSIVRT